MAQRSSLLRTIPAGHRHLACERPTWRCPGWQASAGSSAAHTAAVTTRGERHPTLPCPPGGAQARRVQLVPIKGSEGRRKLAALVLRGQPAPGQAGRDAGGVRAASLPSTRQLTTVQSPRRLTNRSFITVITFDPRLHTQTHACVDAALLNNKKKHNIFCSRCSTASPAAPRRRQRHRL